MPQYFNQLENNRKKVCVISFFVFALWMLLFIVRFNGYYAHDELYHVSAGNSEFFATSRYTRAPYLNLAIHFLSSVFGKNYYVYKSVPFILSLISMGIFLYLLNQIALHTYSIICFACLMCTHSLLIVNHMFVRMYICDEAVIAILALILYQLTHVGSALLRIALHILYFVSAFFLYLFYHYESSALAVLGVGVMAWILNYIGIILVPYLKKKRCVPIALISCAFLIISMLLYIIAIRTGTVSCPGFLSRAMVYHYTIDIVEPVFTGYFLTKGIFLTIGLIGFGYVLLKKDLKHNLLGIYLLGLLPFLAYNILYFDQRLFRAFASFLPVIIFITILWLDQFPVTKKSIYRLAGVTVLTALFSYPRATMHIKEFYTLPYSVGEITFDDYGSLVNQAAHEISNGKKCISIWVNDHAEAAFNDLDCEVSYCLEDDLNNQYAYTEQDLLDFLTYLDNLTEPYILVVAPDCARKISARITPQFMNTLCEQYSYTEYLQDSYLFYIN